MLVSLIYRKKNPAFFSIERVFSEIENELGKKVTVDKFSVPRLGVSFRNVMAVLSFCRKNKSDIYHVTGDIHYVVFGLPRRRTLLTIHDCVFLYRSKGIKRLILKKLLLDGPVRRSGLVTTISEATRQDILRYTGCSPAKVVVISNPVNEGIQYRPHRFREAQPVILFIGITPNKNLLRVIPALAGIDCQLHVIGEIPSAEKMLLQQYHISYRQSVHLTDPELAACYTEADMVLFPSTFEGFGLPILEAQKAGRPVITSNISPMREVAGNGTCLVDPYSIDSIRAGVLLVLRDAGYREELVKEGLQNIQRFNVAAIASQYIECYKKLNALI